MAKKTMSYDHPAYLVRPLAHINLPASSASASVTKFAAFTSMKIKSIGAIVNVAGTDTGAGWDILNGTTSVGQIVASTNAAASILTQFEGDIALSSGGYLDIKTKAASATLAGALTVEYELTPGANVTV